VSSDSETDSFLREGSGPLDDLALTLPIFVGYHLGVAFMPMRNAADLVTHELAALANYNMVLYAGLTLAIGIVFAGVLLVLGREYSLSAKRFLLVAVEGVLYAVAMRLSAAYVVGKLHLTGGAEGVGALASLSPFTAVVMSLGAGFYEELAFRVGLFGLGRRLVLPLFGASVGSRRAFGIVVWAVLCAALFSGWHYVGELGDPFDLRSFVFRWVCGVAFTAIYAFRGFAPAVWTHTLYDIWVLAL
jgi:hypothetical protein